MTLIITDPKVKQLSQELVQKIGGIIHDLDPHSPDEFAADFLQLRQTPSSI